MELDRTFAWALARSVGTLCGVQQAAAQTARIEARSIEAPELEIPTAPVIIDGKPLFYVRGSTAFLAAERSRSNCGTDSCAAAIATIVFVAAIWLTLRTLRWLMRIVELPFQQRVRSVGI